MSAELSPDSRHRANPIPGQTASCAEATHPIRTARNLALHSERICDFAVAAEALRELVLVVTTERGDGSFALAEVLVDLGRNELGRGAFGEAEKVFRQACEIGIARDNIFDQVEIALKIAHAYENHHLLDQACLVCEQCLKGLSDGDPEHHVLISKAFASRGRAYLKMGRQDLAESDLISANAALKKAPEVPPLLGLTTRFWLAKAYSESGTSLEAAENVLQTVSDGLPSIIEEESLSFEELDEALTLGCLVLEAQAQVAAYKKYYLTSISLLDDALTYASTKLENPAKVGQLQRLLSDVAFSGGDLDSSLKYAKAAQRTFEQSAPKDPEYARALQGEGRVYAVVSHSMRLGPNYRGGSEHNGCSNKLPEEIVITINQRTEEGCTQERFTQICGQLSNEIAAHAHGAFCRAEDFLKVYTCGPQQESYLVEVGYDHARLFQLREEPKRVEEVIARIGAINASAAEQLKTELQPDAE